MNRSLLALAVAGAVAPAVALADESNVTIGGRAAAQFDVVSATGATAGSAADIPTRNRVTDIASRIFFRGTENLGGDLKAIFFVQANTPLDGQADRDKLFCGGGTECYVGLAGSFGDVTLGRKHRAFYAASNRVDPWDILTLGSIDAIVYVAPGKIGGGITGFQATNGVFYRSPDWGGFKLGATYGAGENKTSTTNSTDEYGLSGSYSVGPFYAALGWQRKNGAQSGDDSQSTGLAVAYKFSGGPLLGAIYEWHKATTLGVERKINDWAATVTWPIGQGDIRANYARDTGIKGDPVVSAGDSRSKHWAVGYAYHVSKRTELYGQYAKINNGPQAHNDFDAGVGGVANGASPKGFALGIIHYY